MLTLILKDIVQKDGLHAENTASLKEVIEIMKKNGKGMVVILRDEKPVGVMTERDIVEVLHRGADLEEPAYAHTKKALVSARGDRTLGHALTMMMENNIRRIIAVAPDGSFIGAATQQDLLKHLEEDFYRSFVKVKHIIEQQKELISVERDALISHTLEKMVLNRISSVPVVQDGKAVGILTEKDVLNLASRNVDMGDPVSAHMSAPVISVGRETTLIDVVKIMNEKNIRRVVIDDGAGAPAGVITIRDVLRNLEGDYAHFLERKLKHTKDVLNLFPESLVELTDTGEEQLIIWANDRALSRFGRKVLDKPANELVPAERWSDIYHSLITQGRIEDVKFKSSNGVYELSGFYVVTEGQLEKGRIQLIFRDITEEVKLATTDALTSMYNRRFLNDFMAKELYRSKRMNRQFTVAILDLDDFKQVNDTHGHLSGDMVLQHISSLLTKNLRLSDVIGRYGGEEFLLLMPETSKEGAGIVVERLREKIAGELITLPDDVKIGVTASFGGSTFPEDGLSTEDLLITADERLYRAKKGGKNLAVFR